MRLSSSSSSSAVVPLPIRSPFDQQLTAELDALHLHLQQQSPLCSNESESESSSSHYAWILQALKASTSAQQITLSSLGNVTTRRDSDKQIINKYLDANTILLDTCNELTERIEMIQDYVGSLRLVSSRSAAAATSSSPVGEALDSCRVIERRCNAMGKINYKCGSLNKMFNYVTMMSQNNQDDSRLGEMLSGSTAVTSTVCAILENALSFKKSKSNNGCNSWLPLMMKRTSSSWCCSLQQMQRRVIIKQNQLQRMVKAAKSLQMRKQNGVVDVEELKRSCGKIERGIKPLEGSIKELYKSLISVRMALLGILSQM